MRPLLQVCVCVHCSKCVYIRCVCVCVCVCVCALGWVKCREHISLLVILRIIVYVTIKKKNIYIYISVIVFFQNRYPIMVKCLNIGKPIYRSISNYECLLSFKKNPVFIGNELYFNDVFKTIKRYYTNISVIDTSSGHHPVPLQRPGGAAEVQRG